VKASPTIYVRYRSISASKLVNALAHSLTDIKVEDELTDSDVGAILGKGDDQAAKYRTGLAEMSVTTFMRGCAAWNGRFANEAFAQVGMKLIPLDAGEQTDMQGVTSLMRAVLALQEALEDDGVVDDVELAQRRSLIEDAGRYVDQCRDRLRLRSVG
jgi:hypothetical protein